MSKSGTILYLEGATVGRERSERQIPEIKGRHDTPHRPRQIPHLSGRNERGLVEIEHVVAEHEPTVAGRDHVAVAITLWISRRPVPESPTTQNRIGRCVPGTGCVTNP